MKFLKFLIQDNDCVIIWADQIDNYCYFVSLEQNNGDLNIYRYDHKNKVLVDHTPSDIKEFDWSKYDNLTGLGCSFSSLLKQRDICKREIYNVKRSKLNGNRKNIKF